MDSLTQVVLGGAVGYALMGKYIGPKAALYGAALGTLPDLDVFIDFGGPIENFTFHRSFSHSLLVQLLISPFIAWMLNYLHTKNTRKALSGAQPSLPRDHRWRWFWLVFLTLSTHALLDSCNVYGTQLFWPLSEYPVGISNLFIIDPLYTLPLLLGFIVCLMPRFSHARRQRAICYGLTLSSVYLLWSLAAKIHIDSLNKQAMAHRNIQSTHYVSSPAPFTTLLWRTVVVDKNHYYEIYTSIFDDVNDVSIDAYPTYPELLSTIKETWAVQRLQWFTKGAYAVNDINGDIVISDLRMGIEGSYVFAFKVGENMEGEIIPSPAEKLNQRPDIRELGYFFKRIFDPSVSLTPAARSREH